MKNSPLGPRQLELLELLGCNSPKRVLTTGGEREFHPRATELAGLQGRIVNDIRSSLQGLAQRGLIEEVYLPDCPAYTGYVIRRTR